MTLSGPHLGVMPSVCRSQPESGSDTAPVHTAASQRSRTDAADPRAIASNINPGEAESNSDIRRESEFDAAGFVEFAERHLEWLDRVDSAEAVAWHEVRSRGGRIYTCVPMNPDAEGIEPICLDLFSEELLTSPAREHIQVATSSPAIRKTYDRCVATIEAELPAYDVPDALRFSTILNTYFGYACQTDLASLLARIPPAVCPNPA
ncbi:hypothetical protein [Rhodococcus zopfii]|uniref:hypothetical protein n=1 Tax=Rhodococcus zopfii TaxID=43772 RepID=UPI00111128C5|nr:hypothetical protein [Rhodococcus zopfii]